MIKPAKNIAPPPPSAPRGPAQKKAQLPSLRATKKPVVKQLQGSTHFTAHVPVPGSGLGGGLGSSRNLLGDPLGAGGGGGTKTFAQEQVRGVVWGRHRWSNCSRGSPELAVQPLIPLSVCMRHLPAAHSAPSATLLRPHASLQVGSMSGAQHKHAVPASCSEHLLLSTGCAQEEARKAAEKKRRRKGSASAAAAATPPSADDSLLASATPPERSISAASSIPSAEVSVCGCPLCKCGLLRGIR